MSKTQKILFAWLRRVHRHFHAADRDLRLHAAQEQRRSRSRTSSSSSTGSASGVFSINRAVLYLFIATLLTIIHDGVDRPADAGAAEQGPDRGRGAVFADAEQHHPGEHARLDGGQVVPVPRARCSCSSGSATSSAICRCRRTARRSSTCSAPTSRRSRSTRRPRTSRSRWSWHWSCSSRSTSWESGHRAPIGYLKSLIPAGVHGRDAALDLPDRGDLHPDAAAVADHPALGQHLRRPHHPAVPGRRARRDPRAVRRSGGSRFPPGSSSTCSSWAWWPRSRRSSSRPWPRSTSAGAVTHH